jgi:hypothetical protein
MLILLNIFEPTLLCIFKQLRQPVSVRRKLFASVKDPCRHGSKHGWAVIDDVFLPIDAREVKREALHVCKSRTPFGVSFKLRLGFQ